MFKRVALSLLAVACISLLVTGASFALFTATTTNQQNTFSAGTVILMGNPVPCTIDNIAPGDTVKCTGAPYQVSYTGSLDAWIGLDTTLAGDLTTCGGGGKFTGAVTDQSNKSYNSSLVNQVVAMAHTNDAFTFYAGGTLDISAPNDCQAKSATLTLLVHAVQARNNTKLDAANNPVGPISWS